MANWTPLTVWAWRPNRSLTTGKWERWTDTHRHSVGRWQECPTCAVDGPKAAEKWLVQAQRMEPETAFALAEVAPTTGPAGEPVEREETVRQFVKRVERETGLRHPLNMMREHMLEAEERKRARPRQ